MSIAAYPKIENAPAPKIYGFGDIWLIDQILQKTGLNLVLDNLMPSKKDTLKALVGYKLSENIDLKYAKDWYPKSYASVLYPKAKVDSLVGMRKFHSELGSEENFNRFTELYLDTIITRKDIKKQILFPVAVDSYDLPRDIESFLTPPLTPRDLMSFPMKITYVVDYNTKLPITLRLHKGFLPGFLALFSTINFLKYYDVDLKLAVVSGVIAFEKNIAGVKNINDVLDSEIPVVFKMPPMGKRHAKLMKNYDADFKRFDNAVILGENRERKLYYVKNTTIDFDGRQLFAYLTFDYFQSNEDITNALFARDEDDKDSEKQFEKAFDNAGKFVLLSSQEFSKKEILPLYYLKRTVTRLTDIVNTYIGEAPEREYSESYIRGVMLISFIATSAYTFLNNMLSGSGFSASEALAKMKYARLASFDRAQILDELNEDQKNILKHLSLSPPFAEKSDKRPRKQDSDSPSARQKARGKGRPKSAQNTASAAPPNPPLGAGDPAANDAPLRAKDRPRNSENKARKTEGSAKVSGENAKRRERNTSPKSPPKKRP
ncbi:MAG: hypothetical protein LBO66_12715 [Deltaproteobacteria bacterium]|jgi:hypothetical protein|nr:hypothetical protein [Deltaproteobacteria bacterium]